MCGTEIIGSNCSLYNFKATVDALITSCFVYKLYLMKNLKWKIHCCIIQWRNANVCFFCLLVAHCTSNMYTLFLNIYTAFVLHFWINILIYIILNIYFMSLLQAWFVFVKHRIPGHLLFEHKYLALFVCFASDLVWFEIDLGSTFLV